MKRKKGQDVRKRGGKTEDLQKVSKGKTIYVCSLGMANLSEADYPEKRDSYIIGLIAEKAGKTLHRLVADWGGGDSKRV